MGWKKKLARNHQMLKIKRDKEERLLSATKRIGKRAEKPVLCNSLFAVVLNDKREKVKFDTM